jgi:ABC-type transport system substrate-binding protein
MKIKLLSSIAAAVVATTIMATPAWAENVIRWASQGDALTSDPHGANESPTHSASRKVYDVLYYNDKDMKLTPWLATGFKLVNPTTWEFSLRKGVKFHDGSDFTATDVKFSIERAALVELFCITMNGRWRDQAGGHGVAAHHLLLDRLNVDCLIHRLADTLVGKRVFALDV